MKSRFNYWQRIFRAYVLKSKSQLTFWHEMPSVNEDANFSGRSDPYFMPFYSKSLYTENMDDQGIPKLNYHGTIGLQYNPIAIAQFGLGLVNRYHRGERNLISKIKNVALFMTSSLRKNDKGVLVWMHDFDFEYDSLLKAPWYSGLAQGQGVSFLCRASSILEDAGLIEYIMQASDSLFKNLSEGGTLYTENQDVWLEEYITEKPTHILNGFIWGLWGLWDLYHHISHKPALSLFERLVATLEKNLHRYDTGYWSLYDLSHKPMPNPASPFYHDLHIIQMDIMHRLTGKPVFKVYHDKFLRYRQSRLNRGRALIKKSFFKLRYF